MKFILWLIVALAATNAWGADKTSNPSRVVSTFVGADELLVQLLNDQPSRILGLSPLAGDRRYSAIFSEAKKWTKPTGNELEGLLELKPDLVIAASYTRSDWLQMLKIAKVPSLILNRFKSIEDIKFNTLKIGEAIGKTEKAKQLIVTFENDLKKLHSSCPIKGKSVLTFSKDGTFYGANTIIDDMFKVIGATNLATQLGIKGWAKMSSEQLAILSPDYIVASGEPADRSAVLKAINSQKGWRRQKNFSADKLILIPGRYLFSVTHHLVRALEIACEQS